VLGRGVSLRGAIAADSELRQILEGQQLLALVLGGLRLPLDNFWLELDMVQIDLEPSLR